MSGNHGEKHCNQTVYLVWCVPFPSTDSVADPYSFWYIIACYIFTGVMCCLGCLLACCFLRNK